MRLKSRISAEKSILVLTALMITCLFCPHKSFCEDATKTYQAAMFLESSGKDMQAAGEYLRILVDYPDDKDVAKESFLRLKDIYDSYIGGEWDEQSEIFLTYVKNIYNRYKEKGQYEKALEAIRILAKIRELSDYYNDMGNIYLYELNNPKLAMNNLEKAIRLKTQDAGVYTNIGLAYELLGDYDKAIISYKKAYQMAPLNSWTLYGMKRIDGIELARKKQLIKDWFFMGPFRDGEYASDIEEEIVEDPDTTKEYASGTGEIFKWFRPYEYEDYGYVNLGNVFLPQAHACAYALTYIYSPKKDKALFKIGSDDGVTVRVNRKIVWDNPEQRLPSLDNDIVEVALEKGWNEVLLRISQKWGGWGFYFRVTDPEGRNADGLIFDPAKDEARTISIIAERERKELLRKAEEAMFYGLSGTLFLLSVILIIFTIKNSIKMREMREDFTASITHDLSVPLSAIMASAEVLLDGGAKTEEKRKEYYKTIAGGAERLNSYIYKILDFKRSKKKNPYSLKKTEIVPVVKRAIEIYKRESHCENLDVTLDVKGDALSLEIDEEAFIQVIINLLSNADKYSLKDKRIEVGVCKEREDIKISIKDRGIGIHPSQLKKIFKKFYRTDDKEVKKIQGIGLGLFAVKNIVEAHGGKIGVESSPGKGSTFTVILPVR
ncbi:MAG: hypothetical protein A2Z72_00350 [Omnitrophica bacterium RBG_13_46_9]|nr:MAG: hypothetical protein A2Z72_00350 [Omnitrophica bacterium RBG_13_46_9]